MTTTAQYLDALRAEIGYQENPAGSNLNKFADIAGHLNGYSWCATFQVAIANQTGLPLPAGTESAYTPTSLNSWRRAGMSSTTPQVGAFAYFKWPGMSRDICDHTGVVESFNDATVTTIDGNTARDGSNGSDSNGGEVARKTRSRSLVVGYGLPAYTAIPIGDLFMHFGPRTTARILHRLAWGHEPTAPDLDVYAYDLDHAATDVATDAVVASIFDRESK